MEKIIQFLEAADGAEYKLAQIAQQADVTPGEDLEAVKKEMQVSETEAKNNNAPPCVLEAKSALTSYMETLIQGYFGLYTQGIGITPEFISDGTTAGDEFNLAASKLEFYETKMEELKNLVLEKSKSE